MSMRAWSASLTVAYWIAAPASATAAGCPCSLCSTLSQWVATTATGGAISSANRRRVSASVTIGTPSVRDGPDGLVAATRLDERAHGLREFLAGSLDQCRPLGVGS